MAKKKWISSTTKKKLYIIGSGFFLDLAKLVFAGVIIAGIMGMEINNSLVVISGVVAVMLLSLVGLLLFIRGNQKL